MTSSFDFDAVDTFAAGAVGEPGRRVFYFQIVTGSTVISLKAEKQQVALLADYLERLVATVDFAPSAPAHMPTLVEPPMSEWTVGSLMVAVNTATARIVVVASELTEGPEDEDEGDEDSDDDTASNARVALTVSQVEAFIEGARQVVMAGRPPCRWCGRPEDPDEHFCPRMN